MFKKIALWIVDLYVKTIRTINGRKTGERKELQIFETAGTRTLPNKYIKIMTYNVHGLPWPLRSGKKRAFKYIGKQLKISRENGTGPVIVLLQEAFSRHTKLIAKLSGYRYYIKPKKVFGLFNSGLWILSDYPIEKAEEISFGSYCGGFDCLSNKSVSLVTLSIQNNKKLHIVNTHLNSINSSGISKEEAMAIQKKQISVMENSLRYVDETDYTIMAGDFNIRPNQENYKFLLNRLEAIDAAEFCKNNDTCIIGDLSIFDNSVDRFLLCNEIFDVVEIYKSFTDSILELDLSDHDAIIIKVKPKSD